jgi:kynureninase
MSLAATLEHARARDAADPLRVLRERFVQPRTAAGGPVVYLAGHSLGLAPKDVRAAVGAELDEWERLAVLGHEHARRPWIEYAEGLAAGLARLAGAQPTEVVAMNSLTVNLHLMLASFYRPSAQRPKILVESGAFASDRHAIVSQIEWHGLDPAATLIEVAPREGEDLVRNDDVELAIERHGAQLALVLWPGVQFRTGQWFDLARIATAGARAGARVGFDLAHSIGNVPLALHDSDADFAVWCSYKYLNAGPGAIGGAFVHARHTGTPQLRRLAGWWGHELASRFEMRPGFVPAAGAAGWAVSNPPILSAAPLFASLAVFEEAGMQRLRAKSLALSAYCDELLGELVGSRVCIVNPLPAEARGAQLSLRLAGDARRGAAVFEALRRADIICDYREPDIIRVAPVPLYNSFADVLQFAQGLRAALDASPR